MWYAPPLNWHRLYRRPDLGTTAHCLHISGHYADVQNGRVSNLFSGLAIRALNDKGNPMWFITGFIQLDAPASIFDYDGRAYAFIRLTSRAALVSTTGDALITFDELTHLQPQQSETLAMQIQLSGGFGISIRACIRICAWKCWHKCWTIVQKIGAPSFTPSQWDPSPAGHRKSGRRHQHGVFLGSSGSNDDNVALFILSTSADGNGRDALFLSPDSRASAAIAPRSRSVGAPHQAGSYGGSGNTPFEWQVNGIAQLTVFPNSPLGTLTVDQSAVADMSEFTVSVDHVGADNSMGVDLQQCRNVRLTNPQPFTRLTVTGTACPLQATTDRTQNVTVTGDVSDYRAPVQLAGAQFLQVSVPLTTYTINSDSVVSGGLLVTTSDPVSVSNMVVSAHPTQASTVTVNEVPAYRSVVVSGGSDNDLFLVPNVATLLGLTHFDGNLGRSNNVTVNLFLHPMG